MIKQLHLFRRSVNSIAVNNKLVGVKVDNKLIKAQPFLAACLLALAAAQNGMNSGKQLFDLKGLNDIVVSAHLKSVDLVVSLTLGGQHDYGRFGLFTHLRANLPAIKYGKHNVQQNKRRLLLQRHLHTRTAIGSNAHFKAVLFKIKPQQLGNVAVVLDYKRCFCHINTPFRLN